MFYSKPQIKKNYALGGTVKNKTVPKTEVEAAKESTLGEAARQARGEKNRELAET